MKLNHDSIEIGRKALSIVGDIVPVTLRIHVGPQGSTSVRLSTDLRRYSNNQNNRRGPKTRFETLIERLKLIDTIYEKLKVPYDRIVHTDTKRQKTVFYIDKKRQITYTIYWGACLNPATKSKVNEIIGSRGGVQQPEKCDSHLAVLDYVTKKHNKELTEKPLKEFWKTNE